MLLGGVMVFDPPAGGTAPTVEAVREHLAARLGDARLGELPRYTQRLSSARTHGFRVSSPYRVIEVHRPD